MKRRGYFTTQQFALALACGLSSVGAIVHAQDPISDASPSGDVRAAGNPWAAQSSQPPQFMAHPRFKIPFSIDTRGSRPAAVQLWVSIDEGRSWQRQASSEPDQSYFEFRAASEGEYLFAVKTIDDAGVAFPSDTPPLRVVIDTSKPRAALRADIGDQGQLIVDLRVQDDHLDLDSTQLRLRTDRSSDWQEVALDGWNAIGDIQETQVTVPLEPCREVALVFSIADAAGNTGESTFQLDMPRTAAGASDMTLASARQSQAAGEPSSGKPSSGTSAIAGNAANTAATNATASSSAAERPRLAQLRPLPGATAWQPTGEPAPDQATAEAAQRSSPGRLTATGQLGLSLEPIVPASEELPTPPLYEVEPAPTTEPLLGREPAMPPQPNEPRAGNFPTRPVQTDAASPSPLDGLLDLGDSAGSPTAAAAGTSTGPQASRLPPVDREQTAGSDIGQAFHSNSRAFSLDYSVEAMGGTSLSDVELWGTEDGGRTWQKWGSDPDRQSPFDVQVGNDGLFGYRMVIVGANGLVSNRPKAGDSADVWIHIDTDLPTARITQAVYGEGGEDGMLVIDYTCHDQNLVERPVTLYYSANQAGPWQKIAMGLKNSQVYLWKPAPETPERVYLKLEAADKAGNVGEHILDLLIDVKGLAPRGRIQGFRPINK